MSRSKSKRRWLQFSLRSVLLLTLAVALWLGYEVHQARQVEQTIAGITALDGNAECELTGWSLLRLCRVPQRQSAEQADTLQCRSRSAGR